MDFQIFRTNIAWFLVRIGFRRLFPLCKVEFFEKKIHILNDFSLRTFKRSVDNIELLRTYSFVKSLFSEIKTYILENYLCGTFEWAEIDCRIVFVKTFSFVKSIFSGDFYFLFTIVLYWFRTRKSIFFYWSSGRISACYRYKSDFYGKN
jgi:hypothetical protein